MNALPEDIQRSLEDKDWDTYRRLCHRYNLEPTEYMNYLIERGEMLKNALKVDDSIDRPDLTYLSRLAFQEIRRVDITRKIKPFDLNGLSSIFLPNLRFLNIDISEGNLSGLEDFTSTTLTNLDIRSSCAGIRRIKFPKLTTLVLPSTGNFFTDILNRSKMSELRCLSFDRHSGDSINLSNIKWHKYPYLSDLSLTDVGYLYYTSIPTIYTKKINPKTDGIIILDKGLEQIRDLTYLSTTGTFTKVERKVILINVKRAILEVRCLDDLRGLCLPQLVFMSIYTHEKDDLIKTKKKLRHIVKIDSKSSVEVRLKTNREDREVI